MQHVNWNLPALVLVCFATPSFGGVRRIRNVARVPPHTIMVLVLVLVPVLVLVLVLIIIIIVIIIIIRIIIIIMIIITIIINCAV